MYLEQCLFIQLTISQCKRIASACRPSAGNLGSRFGDSVESQSAPCHRSADPSSLPASSSFCCRRAAAGVAGNLRTLADTRGAAAGALATVLYSLLHGSMGHIFFNMFAVYMFGSDLERLWGGRRFALTWIASVLTAA